MDQHQETAGNSIDQTKMEQLRKALPGRDVPLGDSGVSARVEPARFRQAVEVVDLVAATAGAIGPIAAAAGGKGGDEAFVSAILRAIPTLPKERLIPIVQPCCDVDLEALPLDWLCAVLQAWLEETLDPKKLQRWRDLGLLLTGLLDQDGDKP